MTINFYHKKIGILFAISLMFVAVFAIMFLNGKLVTVASAATDGWHIKDDAKGGDCSSIGNWDKKSKTCTLTKDLDQPIKIDSDNINLDGNNHKIIGTDADYNAISGVYLNQRTGVVVKNINVRHFANGIGLTSSYGNVIKNNIFPGPGGGIYMGNSTNNTISRNTFSAVWGFGVLLESSSNNLLEGNSFYGTGPSGGANGFLLSLSNDNTIKGNNISNYAYGISSWQSGGNTILENTILNCLYGLFFGRYSPPPESSNEVYHNNFVNSTGAQAYLYGNGIDLFNLPGPMGGNYWSDYSTPDQGCVDANSDNFCDAPYIIKPLPISTPTTGYDNLPWTKKDGWKRISTVARDLFSLT